MKTSRNPEEDAAEDTKIDRHPVFDQRVAEVLRIRRTVSRDVIYERVIDLDSVNAQT
jgi:hypothetical protein